MKRISVVSFASTPFGVFSRFSVDKFSCFSLECLNRKEGKPRCISRGIYRVKLDMFYGGDGLGGKRDYPAYELQKVPDFSEVKIHIGNYYTDVVACLCLGRTIDWDMVKNIPMVTSGKMTFEQFMLAMAGDKEAEIELRWADERIGNGLY